MAGHAYLFTIFVSLALGLAAGAIMYRSDYCLAGMFRDLFLFRRADMLRTLVLLVVASMVLFEAARLFGLLPLYPFPLLYPPTAANVLGGFLFGVGMVLAGGCVVGTLYKMGAGSVPSAVTLGGLIAGSALYAEFHPQWKALIGATTFFKGRITVPQILGIEPTLPLLVLALAGGALLLHWGRQGKLRRASPATGYLQPWKAALLLAVIGLLSWYLIGMPLGITSSYAKIAGYLEGLFFPDHVLKSAYFQAMPLDCVQPLTGARLRGGGGPFLDAIAAIQFPLLAGIVLGSAIAAALVGELKFHFHVPYRQLVSAFAGGLIMGLASRMAPTCNVWHLLGGLPILAASSILFLTGLVPGAWAGSRLFTAWVIRRG